MGPAMAKRARNPLKHIHPPSQNALPQHHFSTTASRKSSDARPSRGPYDQTLANLVLRPGARVMFQGFTGRQATVNARESMAWGTNVVGGVKPGHAGEHLGLPVLPSVRRAMEELRPDATGVYVPGAHAVAAIEEAIEAEVPLVVAVAEHIPVHDVLRIHAMLATQSRTRLVGANAPGIISPVAKCRIGFQPLSCFLPGPVGVIAKSGTLSYETVGSLTRAGVGQSLCIGMGGDIVAGTDFVDALKVFETDENTLGIVVVGEVGGTAEEEAAEWIRDYRSRVKDPKPIAALVAGMCAQEGKVMGHAGAWKATGEGSATDKWNALEAAGCVMVDHPAKFGGVMKGLLEGKTNSKPFKVGQQSRGYHTSSRPPMTNGIQSQVPRRSFYLSSSQASTLLAQYKVLISDPQSNAIDNAEDKEIALLGIAISRSDRSPCIIASPTTSYDDSIYIPFSYQTGPHINELSQTLSYLGLRSAPSVIREQVGDLIESLWTLFRDKEAISAVVQLSTEKEGGNMHLAIADPLVALDPASPKNDLVVKEDTDGIVYHRLPGGDEACVGTLVNGAGLAMNTCDALGRRGVSPANFLDTGGKATSDTVARAMEMVLADVRVRVLFVNIFGGLTECDMIARGIIQAFDKLKASGGVKVPVVVRLRGTREEEGQRVIGESGLQGVWAFDGFEDAVGKIKDLLVSSGS